MWRKTEGKKQQSDLLKNTAEKRGTCGCLSWADHDERIGGKGLKGEGQDAEISHAGLLDEPDSVWLACKQVQTVPVMLFSILYFPTCPRRIFWIVKSSQSEQHLEVNFQTMPLSYPVLSDRSWKKKNSERGDKRLSFSLNSDWTQRNTDTHTDTHGRTKTHTLASLIWVNSALSKTKFSHMLTLSIWDLASFLSNHIDINNIKYISIFLTVKIFWDDDIGTT